MPEFTEAEILDNNARALVEGAQKLIDAHDEFRQRVDLRGVDRGDDPSAARVEMQLQRLRIDASTAQSQVATYLEGRL